MADELISRHLIALKADELISRHLIALKLVVHPLPISQLPNNICIVVIGMEVKGLLITLVNNTNGLCRFLMVKQRPIVINAWVNGTGFIWIARPVAKLQATCLEVRFGRVTRRRNMVKVLFMENFVVILRFSGCHLN